MNWKSIIKTFGFILIFILILVIGFLFMIIMAVKDMNTDFVKKHNITEIDCSELTNKIIYLDYTCEKYFSRNKQSYCKRNITNHYLSMCFTNETNNNNY